jgi:hypothetical protein
MKGEPPRETLLELPPFAGMILTVRLRRPALAGLFAAGIMPNVLLPVIEGIMHDRKDRPSKVRFAELADMNLRVAEVVIVEPDFDLVGDLLTKQHTDILWRYLTDPAYRFADLAKSQKFFSLAVNCKRWGTRPSLLLRIRDPYTAYCLDDAASYLLGLVEGGKEPSYLHELSEREKDEMSRRCTEAAIARCRKREQN